MALQRHVEITPAFDKRHADPGKNYGVHGCDLIMVLHGDLGATQFVLFTQWHLPHVAKEHEAKTATGDFPVWLWQPQPADVGYHSPTPIHDYQTPVKGECKWTGGRCYYDGSSLDADGVYKAMLRRGSEAVWEILEERYVELFGEAS